MWLGPIRWWTCGGASTLVDALVVDGFEDVTVLDVSEVVLDEARRGLGDARGVHWVVNYVAGWLPDRRYRLWHDRAVFHFLVEDDDRAGYLAALRAGLAPADALIMATFTPDGPRTCSGLPVARYSVDELAGAIGTGFLAEATRTERHTTPTGPNNRSRGWRAESGQPRLALLPATGRLEPSSGGLRLVPANQPDP